MDESLQTLRNEVNELREEFERLAALLELSAQRILAPEPHALCHSPQDARSKGNSDTSNPRNLLHRQVGPSEPEQEG